MTRTWRASIWAGGGEKACFFRYSWSSVEIEKGHGDRGQCRCNKVKLSVYGVSERLTFLGLKVVTEVSKGERQ